MTYRDYLAQSDFSEIWKHLENIYKESTDIKETYQRLYGAAKELPRRETSEEIRLETDYLGEVKALNTLDTQEELIDRAVVIGNGVTASPSEVAAHLLYWSSIYGFETARQHDEDFVAWLEELHAGPYYDSKGMLKYIFLDFDGVLNSGRHQAELAVAGRPDKDSYGALFDPRAVAQLNRLLDATKARIVVISSWRFALDRHELDLMWEERGLPGEIAYVLNTSVADSDRGEGISHFPHGKSVPYVILDDEDYTLPGQKDYLIRINPQKGLTAADVDKAIEILNRFDGCCYSDFYSDLEAHRQRRQRKADIEAPSLDRKRLRYWRDAIICDSAISWSFSLSILRKKLEFNIGYWKYVRRHVGWEQDVQRMQLCRSLLDIAASDYGSTDGIYINRRNAARYGITVRSDSDDYNLYELRKAKAYKILWPYLDHNLRDWWD